MSSFDDYIQMQERLNQQLNILSSPLLNPYPSFLNPAAELGQMAYSPIQEWAESYMKILAPIQEMLDNLADIPIASVAAAFQDPSVLATSFQEIIPPDIAQNFENLNTFFVEQFSTTFDFLISSNSANESDYVIVNEKPFKEICVPDSLAIPIGNYRVKIKTEHFITILVGVLSFIAGFITSIPSLNVSQVQEEQICIQAQQWQNHLLEQIFESIDASFSTQAESLNAFKETKEAQIKAFQKQEEAAQAQIKAARKQEEAAQAQIKAARKQEEAAQAQIKAAQAQERAAEALEEAADSFREASDSVKEPEYIEPHK